MLAALKSEYRKLTSVRSTYFIIIITALFVLLIAGIADGFKVDKAMLKDPMHLANEITGAFNIGAVFIAVIAVLLFSHEYRYNTIMYTLTSANRRTKVLIAKVLVTTALVPVFAFILAVIAPIGAYAGIHLAGHDMVAQHMPSIGLLARGLFYMWGFAMLGLVVVAITRNQLFSIVAIFIIPSTLEPALTLVLKDNAKYMPFSSLNAVINGDPHVTRGEAAIIFLVNLVCFWLIAWYLFIKRDATNSRS